MLNKIILSLVLITSYSAQASVTYSLKQSSFQAGVITPLRILALDSDPMIGTQDVSSQFTIQSGNIGKLTLISLNSGVSVYGIVVGNYTISYAKNDGSFVGQSNIDIIPGRPAKLAMISGNGQSAIRNSSFASPLVVKVLDSNGNAVPDYAVNWSGSRN